MPVLLTIGEFSRMTHLSVKALRHYHDLGLLEPADIDPASGYRLYAAGQVGTAQLIRRFRDLEMPLDDVRAVLEAPDEPARNAAIAAHLARMERLLEDTQGTVASLRALLQAPRRPLAVSYRSVPAMPCISIREAVAFDDCEGWLEAALAELHECLAASHLLAGGPDAALYSEAFFEAGIGDVVAFVPASGVVDRHGRVEQREIPPADVAIAVHEGSFADIDQTYAALGTFVAEHRAGVPGPIREYYVAADRTEVCWPVALPQTTGKD
jgi:DNA-binding transcriptional MerR regulator